MEIIGQKGFLINYGDNWVEEHSMQNISSSHRALNRKKMYY